MHPERFSRRQFVMGGVTIVLIVLVIGWFIYDLSPASASMASATPTIFEIKQGESFRTVVEALADAGLVRSSFATGALAVVTGRAFGMQPGLYKLEPSMSAPAILNAITGLRANEVSVTIPEGSNLYQIDAILADALVIRRGDLINFHDDGNLEGKLFPDTYRFFVGSDIKDVVQKFLDNFDSKALPLFKSDPKHEADDIIVASLVAKEVPDANDQKIVAGIIWKRLNQGIPLDIDATICYIKFIEAPTSTPACGSLTQLDYKVDSGYNTYLYRGLPPGPIGNPGITAITAAIAPQSSPYYYYLSDPVTGKTIYAETLDEQNRNRVKYLQSN